MYYVGGRVSSNDNHGDSCGRNSGTTRKCLIKLDGNIVVEASIELFTHSCPNILLEHY